MVPPPRGAGAPARRPQGAGLYWNGHDPEVYDDAALEALQPLDTAAAAGR
jgi:hypothetical protein